MKTRTLKGSAGFPYRGYMVIKKEEKYGNSELTYKRILESSGKFIK
jgi:hypothetical protein